jgi:hypothetical protein
MTTADTAEDALKYCNIVAGSVAAAAEAFPNDASPAAARAQKQQRRALQALMLACLKTAAALADEQQHRSYGRLHVDAACATIEASMRMAKHLALSAGTDAAAHKAAIAADGSPSAEVAAGFEVTEPRAAAGAEVADAASASASSPVSWQDPAASWMLLLARGLIVSGRLMLQRQSDLERQAGGRAVITLVHLEPHIAAFRWLQQQLPHLQLPGAAVAAAQASSSSSSRSNKQHQQLLAQAEELQQTLATVEQNSGQAMIKKYASQLQFIEQLVAFGQSLCYALPSRACCNNPGCSNLARLTERELVSGKGCVCSR